MQDYSRVELSALDNFDVAIVRVDAEGVLTYLNGVARNLLGCPPGMRVDLRMLFPDRKEYENAVANLQHRLQGYSSTYHTCFARPCDPATSPRVPVRVHAFPNSDPEGRTVGAIALVEDMREPEVRMAINRALASRSGTRELLDKVAEEVRRIVPYDEFHVTLISQSGRRMRELYEKGAKRTFRELVRWWTMPDFIRDGLPARVPELCKVDTLRADPRYAALAQTDEDTAAFFALGVREFLSLPVKQNDQVAGFVALYSYRDDTYCAENLEQLQRLPLAEAVMGALHRDRDRRQRDLVTLLQRMGELADDPRKVAREMVDALLRHFALEGWEHVSVFEYDSHAQLLRLICQDNLDKRPLPENFAMPCRDAGGQNGEPAFDGPVQQAALSARAAPRPMDRQGSPRAALPGFDPRGSQLALPILGDDTRWVLYVESRVRNAFAEEETELLDLLAARAGAILAHSTLFEVQEAVLQSMGDAVIETTPDGRIRWSNNAARKLFGLDAGAAGSGGNSSVIADLAADQGAKEALRDTADFYHREVRLKRPGAAEPLAVLLSASTTRHLGGRVYVATDFEYQKQVQRLDELKEVFQQAALEGRVPLALANAWLTQRAAQDPDWRADVERIVRQIARADLPLERLLRLSAPPTVDLPPADCDLGRALAATLAELPGALLEEMEVAAAGAPMPVHGDFNDIQFCIESLIAFGMRTRPLQKKLRLATGLDAAVASVRVEGDWVPERREGVPLDRVERWRRKTLYDMAFGESVLRQIAERAGGRFTYTFGDRLFLEIALPLRRAEGAAS